MFLDWENQYCQNDYIIQSNIQIQGNPYQIANGILTRTTTKKINLYGDPKDPKQPKQFFFLEKLLEFRLYYKATGRVVKNPRANAGDARDVGSISGSGRSPGVGKGNPFQYSCSENFMDKGDLQATVHRAAKGRT